MQNDVTNISPGDVLAVETENGTRHVQVTHVRAPYPDVLRAMDPATTGNAEAIAQGSTAFVAMVELARALRDERFPIRVIGHATIPAQDRPFPTFRLPIRNKAGDIVYWWTWDGEGLTVSPDAGDTDLPIREITPVYELRKRLAGLG